MFVSRFSEKYLRLAFFTKLLALFLASLNCFQIERSFVDAAFFFGESLLCTSRNDDKLRHVNTFLARVGRNLNDPVFNSSNSLALPGAGGRMLKFRVHQRISVISNFATNTFTVLQYHVVSILQARHPWENEDGY